MTHESHTPNSSGGPLLLSGRLFPASEIREIAATVSALAGLSRKEIAHTLCEHLGWRRPDGTNRIDACLAALAKLEKLGAVHPPPVQQRRPQRRRPLPPPAIAPPLQPFTGRIHGFGSLLARPVLDPAEGRQWNSLINAYHWLGHRGAYGNRLRYFIFLEGAGSAPVGCMLFAASAWKVGCRDSWIGWDRPARMARLHLIVNNSRFALFPWVQIRNLASAALAAATRRIRADWQERFGFRPVLLESFTDPGRHRGTCYQAANWLRLGQSAGTGRPRQRGGGAVARKNVFVLPLRPDFRDVLLGLRAPDGGADS